MNTKLKLVVGAAGLSAVAAVALTGGTSAYFYDLEQSTGNSAEACDFDLRYRISGLPATAASGATGTGNGAQNQWANNSNQSINLEGLQPGDTFPMRINVRNFGTCAGDLFWDVDQYVDNENGITEPEASAGDTSAAGDMGSVLDVQSGVDAPSATKVKLNDWAAAGPRRIDSSFTGGDEHTLFVTVSVPNTGRGAENVIMTDSYTFDLDFALAQQGQVTPADIGNLG